MNVERENRKKFCWDAMFVWHNERLDERKKGQHDFSSCRIKNNGSFVLYIYYKKNTEEKELCQGSDSHFQ